MPAFSNPFKPASGGRIHQVRQPSKGSVVDADRPVSSDGLSLRFYQVNNQNIDLIDALIYLVNTV